MAVVTLDRLSKRYDRGAKPAVDEVSLTVEDGEFMVFLGPSGCGKTTTLRMIAGLESISSGNSRSTRASSTACRRRTATSPWCSSPTRSTRI
jgi:ABC-type sugar transport system ATPase subunit